MTKQPRNPQWVELLFCLVLALLATHELDAVYREEWDLLYILRSMETDPARSSFILLHIPLFAGLFFVTWNQNERVRLISQVGLDLFMIIHAILHYRLSSSPEYQFEPIIETITVYGAAIVAAAHLYALKIMRPRGA